MKPLPPRSLSADAVAKRILVRARSRQRGIPPPIKPFRSGLPSLDALARQCWGLNLLAGSDRAGCTALGTQIALSLAQAGQRILWLDLARSVDAPIFYLLTKLSGVGARRIFPCPTLQEAEWTALEAAAEVVARLPIQLAEVHGATPDELRRAIGWARSEGPLGLVVLDHVGQPDRRYLQQVHELADDLQTPVLAVVTVPATADWSDEQALLRGNLPQKPGRLRLRLTKTPVGERGGAGEGGANVRLEVFRAGSGLVGSIPLYVDPALRAVEEGGVPISPAPWYSSGPLGRTPS